MKNFIILSPGKKILSIRKEFKIKQEDITGGDITRNLISIIENDKANLTPPVAKILAYNINKICKEKNIDFSVTEEQLLESVVDQAKKVADKYIEYINSIPSNAIPVLESLMPEIDVFLKTYETEEKKSCIYSILANKYDEAKKFQNAYIYYLRAYESSLDPNITFDILFKLALCAKNLLKYDEAIKFYDTAISLNPSMDFDQQYDFYINKAFCYCKQNKYNLALELLDTFNPDLNILIDKSTQKYVDYLLLKGNCLRETNSFNKAVTVYKAILKNISKDDLENKLLVFLNLCSLYENLNDYTTLRKTCSKALATIDDPEYTFNNNEAYIYYSIGHTLKHLDDLSRSEEFLFKALDSVKDSNLINCYDLSNKIFLDLISIFEIHTNSDKMNYLRNELFEMISMGIFDRSTPLILSFIKYYNNNCSYEDVNNLLSYCLND